MLGTESYYPATCIIGSADWHFRDALLCQSWTPWVETRNINGGLVGYWWSGQIGSDP